VSLTDRDRKILLILVPFVVLAAFWFLMMSPKRDEAAKAGEELIAQEQRRDQAQAQLQQAQQAETSFTADYSEIVRLGKAIPAQVDMPSLLVQLEGAAEGTGIRFNKITAGERTAVAAPAPTAPTTGDPAAPVEAGGTAAQSAPGGAVENANDAAATADAAAAQSGVDPADTQTSTTAEGSGGGLPVGGGTAPAPTGTGAVTAPAGLETVPLTLEFTGNFFNLADFFHAVKRFVHATAGGLKVSGRLVTIEGVRLTSDPELFPKVRAEMGATVYLSPLSEGATAGATPQGPAPTTPAADPAAAPAGTPAPPTAVVTP
jgi:hypothetical protein